MLVAGAGALYLASRLGTTSDIYSYKAWGLTYLAVAFFMLIGIITTLIIPEPEVQTENSKHQYTTGEYLRFFGLFIIFTATFAATFFYSKPLFLFIKESVLVSIGLNDRIAGFLSETFRLFIAFGTALTIAWVTVFLRIVDRNMLHHTYILPVKDFFDRYGKSTAFLLLMLIGFYRISDIVLGVISNIFYVDLGFSKEIIAGITKTFGLAMTIAGGLLGGMLTVRFGVIAILFWGALLSAATNLLFMLLSSIGPNITMLTIVIIADNLSAGLASAAFVAFLSSLTSISFSATQYAIFTSLMWIFPKLIGGYSGTIVSAWGYEKFFLLTALLGLPVLLLVRKAQIAFANDDAG